MKHGPRNLKSKRLILKIQILQVHRKHLHQKKKQNPNHRSLVLTSKKTHRKKKKFKQPKKKFKWLENQSNPKTIIQRSSLRLKLARKLLEDWLLNYSKRHQGHLKTSDSCAQVKEEKVRFLARTYTSKEVFSIVSFLNSWLKVVISRITVALEVKVFMERNSPMRTSDLSTMLEVFSLWPTQDQTQMDHSSSYASTRHHIWTGNTLFLVELSMD